MLNSFNNFVEEKELHQKDINNNYKNYIKLLLNYKFFTFLAFLLIYLLYYLSIQGCFEGVDICPRNIRWIVLKGIDLILSCLLLTIMIILMMYKKISKFHFIHIIIIFSFFFLYSHGLEFHDHGYFNFIAYFLLLFLLLIIIAPLSLIIYYINKKNTKCIFLLFILIFLLIFIIAYLIIMPSSCDDWPKGLNNTNIENNITKYGCQIKYPKKCAYQIFKKFQDYSKIIKKDCKSFKLFHSKEKILESSRSPYINEKANRIGYPLTNKDPNCLIDFIDNNNLLEEYFLNNLVDMDNKTILNEYFKDKMPEVEVDFFNSTQGKLKINLNYNKTLSEERKLFEKNSSPYSNNFILLYIDSVSRANSFRHLKKTLKFIERFMSYEGNYNEKYKTENFHSFQFFKYYSFKYYTGGNYPILFYGQRQDQLEISITKYFKENGYVTCYVGDYCDKDNIRTFHNLTLEEIHDHQFILCDPNKESYNINTIRCLYGKQNSEHLYEYAEQFWRKYPNNRKYLSIITNEGHEGTLNVIKYMDNIVYNFLNNLFNDNLLKDSSIFLLSDHGSGMPSLYSVYDFYKIEKNLPMLYLIINDRKNISYDIQYKYLYENQQTLITGFDIYNTIGHIIYGDNYINIKNKTKNNDTPKSKNGISLFDKINPKERYPIRYNNISVISDYSCI